MQKSLYNRGVDKKVVWKAIKHQIQLLLDIEDILKDKNKNISNDETIFYKNNISKQQDELEKYKKMKMNLYEDWKLGNISEDDYKSYLQDYMDKIEELSKNINYLNEKISEYAKRVEKVKDNPWIESIKKFKCKNELSYEMVNELIDSIEIGADNSITIIFKYRDEYQEILNQVKNNKGDRYV